MKNWKYSLFMVPILLVLFKMTMAQDGIDRITIDELQQKMERRERILIIDARAGNSLLGSQVQIRGAVHFKMSDLENGTAELPRNREIIIYCT